MRTMRRDSRRITSTNRASRPRCTAMPCATGEGVTSGKRTSRPSALEMIFWPTTSTSPVWSGVRWRTAASNRRRATSSPGRTSAMPSMPMTSNRGGIALFEGGLDGPLRDLSLDRIASPKSALEPACDERAALRSAALRDELLEIMGIVDVEGETRETQDAWRQTSCAGGGEVVVEGRLAEGE